MAIVVDILELSFDGLVLASILLLVGLEIGDSKGGMRVDVFTQEGHLLVQGFVVFLSEFVSLYGQASRFLDGRGMARQSGKGRKLCRTVRHAHLRMRLRHMMRQIDDIFVIVHNS